MLRTTLLTLIYAVGWVRFFCKAKKRNPTRMCHQMLGYVIALRLIIYTK